MSRERRNKLQAWLLFGLAFAVPQGAWMLRNSFVPATEFEGLDRFRSVLVDNPNEARSRVLSVSALLNRVVDNSRTYAIYRPAEQIVPGFWSVMAWKGSGWLALVTTIALGAALLSRDRLPITAAVAPMVALNLVYAFGGAARFWVPISLLWLLAVATSVGRWVAKRPERSAIACALLVANLAFYIAAHERHPYNTEQPWQQLADLFEKVGHRNGLRAQNVWTRNSNAFSLVTGLPTTLYPRPDSRYDYAVLRVEPSLLPPGAHVVLSSPPWSFVSLQPPLDANELAALDNGH